MNQIYILGVSGKPGQYTVQHALDRGCKVIGVFREKSVNKLNTYRATLDGRSFAVGASKKGKVKVPSMIQETPAIVGCRTPSALKFKTGCSMRMSAITITALKGKKNEN